MPYNIIWGGTLRCFVSVVTITASGLRCDQEVPFHWKKKTCGYYSHLKWGQHEKKKKSQAFEQNITAMHCFQESESCLKSQLKLRSPDQCSRDSWSSNRFPNLFYLASPKIHLLTISLIKKKRHDFTKHWGPTTLRTRTGGCCVRQKKKTAISRPGSGSLDNQEPPFLSAMLSVSPKYK
jgi:hypothetical protein